MAHSNALAATKTQVTYGVPGTCQLLLCGKKDMLPRAFRHTAPCEECIPIPRHLVLCGAISFFTSGAQDTISSTF